MATSKDNPPNFTNSPKSTTTSTSKDLLQIPGRSKTLETLLTSSSPSKKVNGSEIVSLKDNETNTEITESDTKKTLKTFRPEPPSECEFDDYFFFILISKTNTNFTFSKSPVLSRLQSFLPDFVNSTKELEAKIAQDPTYRDKINLENIEDEDEEEEDDDNDGEGEKNKRPHAGKYIEMDLGLGVCDLIPIEQEIREEDIVMSKDGKKEGKKVSIQVLGGEDVAGTKRGAQAEDVEEEEPSPKKAKSRSSPRKK